MTYIPNPLIIPIGLVVGVLLALPMGPVNVLGLQRAVQRGFFGGMAAGLGIMLGDGLIALCAAMGVNAISGAIRDYRTAIQIVGGLALIVAGAKLYFTKPEFASAEEAADATLFDYVWDIPQTFLLTITNPGAVLGLIAIFGGVSSFVEIEGYIDALTMVAAIMGGSFCYWLVVSRLISDIRHTLDEARMAQWGRWAALVLIGFGCLLIGEMVLKRPGFLGRF
jgi:threonine/homoserine/homoserine lactone efflux protein